MSGVAMRVFFLSGWTAAWDSTWLYARALQQHVEALGGRFIPNELVTDNEPIEQLTQPPVRAPPHHMPELSLPPPLLQLHRSFGHNRGAARRQGA